MDALQVQIRDGAQVQNKAIYLAVGVSLAGIKEVLGLWVALTEGAKLWLRIVTELKNRGVPDIFIACVDELKGFAEAIEAVFAKTKVQLCLIHLARYSLQCVLPDYFEALNRDFCYQLTVIGQFAHQMLFSHQGSDHNPAESPIILSRIRKRIAFMIAFCKLSQSKRKISITVSGKETNR